MGVKKYEVDTVETLKKINTTLRKDELPYTSCYVEGNSIWLTQVYFKPKYFLWVKVGERKMSLHTPYADIKVLKNPPDDGRSQHIVYKD